MNAAPILQTVDLKKHYQQGEHITKALDGVNLSVNAGSSWLLSAHPAPASLPCCT